MKLPSLLLMFAISIGFCTAVAAAPQDPIDTPPWQPTGQYTHPDIRESSGIVASRQFEGVYWTLNDSGNPAALYATKLNGELIQKIAINGSRNFDWEALGIDDKNQLWIGEIGNNSRLRFDLKVVVVAEPDPYTQTEAEVIFDPVGAVSNRTDRRWKVTTFIFLIFISVRLVSLFPLSM